VNVHACVVRGGSFAVDSLVEFWDEKLYNLGNWKLVVCHARIVFSNLFLTSICFPRCPQDQPFFSLLDIEPFHTEEAEDKLCVEQIGRRFATLWIKISADASVHSNLVTLQHANLGGFEFDLEQVDENVNKPVVAEKPIEVV